MAAGEILEYVAGTIEQVQDQARLAPILADEAAEIVRGLTQPRQGHWDGGGNAGDAAIVQERTRRLIAIRRERIVPWLDGARSIGAIAISACAVGARSRLGNGATLALFANLASAPVSVDAPGDDEILYETAAGDADALRTGLLGAHALVALISRDADGA